MAGLLTGQNARLPGASRVIGAGRRPAVRAAAAGATAVALSGDRDQDAALGRRGLHQDRASIAYVQAGALVEPDAAAPAGCRLTSSWPSCRPSCS